MNRGVKHSARRAGPARLRQEAEAHLAAGTAGSPLLDSADAQRLIHELQVHQVELEMQNDELLQAKADLAALLDAYTDLYEFAPVGYLSLDGKGTILRANLTAASLLGTDRSHLLGSPFTRLLKRESHAPFTDFLRDRLAGKPRVTCDLECLPEPGRAAWVRLECNGGAGKPECRVAFLDISEQKRVEEEHARFQAQVHLAQNLESLGTLAGGVAHNFNNILAVIMGTAGQREILTGSPEDQKAYQVIDRACIRGRDLVRSLAHFARPGSMQADFVELNSLVSELRVLLLSTTLNRIRIVEDLFPDPLWVLGNAGDLSSALMNICLNARDALPHGGTITVRTRPFEAERVKLSIEDDGEGMAPEVTARALEPFFTTKEVGKGTGLGLSMAQGVVKAHQGALEIASQLGKGTCISLVLPRVPGPVPAPEPLVDALVPMQLLLVEDEEEVRNQTAQMLQAAGLCVTRAGGGQAALDWLRTGALPDLVIIDQNMPGMDGAATLEAIRALVPGLPVWISSGQPGIEDWDCFKGGKVGFLPKPYNLADFKARLSESGLIPPNS